MNFCGAQIWELVYSASRQAGTGTCTGTGIGTGIDTRTGTNTDTASNTGTGNYTGTVQIWELVYNNASRQAGEAPGYFAN